MAITFKELKRRVMLGFPDITGELALAVDQAINDAHRFIARAQDFPELMALCTTAETVPGKKTYHLVDDLGLIRPKDLYSIRLIDDGASRKLRCLSEQEVDLYVPYPESFTWGRPSFYILYGESVELLKIPGQVYSLYIRYSQWPTFLVEDADVSSYTQIEDVIVQLSKEITVGYLSNQLVDYTPRAKALLRGAVAEDRQRPDALPVARGFRTVPQPLGDYWVDPFIKQVR